MEQLSPIKTAAGVRIVNQNDDPYAVLNNEAGTGRTIYVSVDEPTSPVDGDIWIQLAE